MQKLHKKNIQKPFKPMCVDNRAKEKEKLWKTSTKATVNGLKRLGHDKYSNVWNYSIFFSFRIAKSSNITSLN